MMGLVLERNGETLQWSPDDSYDDGRVVLWEAAWWQARVFVPAGTSPDWNADSPWALVGVWPYHLGPWRAGDSTYGSIAMDGGIAYLRTGPTDTVSTVRPELDVAGWAKLGVRPVEERATELERQVATLTDQVGRLEARISALEGGTS